MSNIFRGAISLVAVHARVQVSPPPTLTSGKIPVVPANLPGFNERRIRVTAGDTTGRQSQFARVSSIPHLT